MICRSRTLALVLFWTGAPLSLLLSLVRMGDFIALRKDLEHVNASWMIAPVGNFVAALVGPVLSPRYTDAMQFWFAVALFSYLVLFVITFYKAIVHTGMFRLSFNFFSTFMSIYFLCTCPARCTLCCAYLFSV
jgi:tellurite resistance protein TehA-like permease